MIKTDQIVPIAELLKRQAQNLPDKTAYSDDRRSITFAELDRATRNLATHFRANGLEDGGSVAIWLPNGVEWVIACLAAVRARGIAVPVSHVSTDDEARYRLDDAQCVIALATPEHAGALSQMAQQFPALRTQIIVGGTADDGLVFEALCEMPAPGIVLAPDDIDGCSYIVYTSGTTGRPKGVMLSSRAMLWATAACWAPILGYGEHDRVLSPLPMFHVFSLTIAVLSPLATGASAHVMDRFSVHRPFELLMSGQFTVGPAGPTMLR
jgi:long-chain acyl-CoA synthetase